MICIRHYSLDPFYNLAAEEYFLKNFSEDIFMLWQNDKAVIVGKNQNTIAEVDYAYAKEHGIKVVRRISGGGAVYHDLGNLNFSLITKWNEKENQDFVAFTKPLIEVLKELNISANFHGRNDVVIDGRKICGNANFVYKDRILHHGSILFDSQLEVLSKVLNNSKAKYQDKSTKSIRSRVCNIKEYLRNDMSVEEFANIFMQHMIRTHDCMDNYNISEEDHLKIKTLAKEKYESWEWNYGKSPDFNLKKQKRTKAGTIEIRMNVSNGIIQDIKIFGDYFSLQNTAVLEDLIRGTWHNEESISSIVDHIDIEEFFIGITKKEFIDLFF